MFAEAILASTLQIGPFWQQWSGHKALCPLWSRERTAATATHPVVDTTDVLWPLFTSHRDWWRFLFVMHCQTQQDGGYQFMLLPIWFNGNDPESGNYWGLFPLWGRHPHFLLMTDWRFCLWPVWMQYKTPRPSEKRWMTSNAVIFPFFHWRDDGSWGVWPLCGTGHRRESDHHYALWPFVTWAKYRKDRYAIIDNKRDELESLHDEYKIAKLEIEEPLKAEKYRIKVEAKKEHRRLNEAPTRRTLEEIGNAVSHGVGALVGITFLVLMILKSHDAWSLAAAIIYGSCFFLQMLFSCLYHSFRGGTKVKRIFRRFDYSSIYLAIGGTFAPLYLIYMVEKMWGFNWGISLFAIQ